MLAWILLAVGLLLVVCTAVYVAAEFALVTVDRAAVDRAAAHGDRRARTVGAGLRRLSTQLSGAQVGITVTTLALGYVMEPSLATLLAGPLAAAGLSEVAAAGTAVTVSLLLATLLSMVFGELVPKNLAIARPLPTARVVIGPLLVTTVLVRPLVWALDGTANGVLRLLGITPQEELRSTRTAQELSALVRRSGEQGTLERPTARLLAQSIAFSRKTADDVLTPRVDVLFVRATDPVGTVIDAALESGRSRFPVTGRDADDVVGLVHLKRVVAVPPDRRPGLPVASVMVPAPVIPGTLPLDDLLVLLRGRGLQMAVVADEYGGTAGIVTLEDVVEELVGEIVDEHDPRAGRAEHLVDGTWLLSGALRPDEIADLTGLRLPESGEYGTVAGLMMDLLGRLPRPGDSVTVPAVLRAQAALGALAGDEAIAVQEGSEVPRPVGARLTARRMEGRRLAQVLVSGAGLGDPARWDAPTEGAIVARSSMHPAVASDGSATDAAGNGVGESGVGATSVGESGVGETGVGETGGQP